MTKSKLRVAEWVPGEIQASFFSPWKHPQGFPFPPQTWKLNLRFEYVTVKILLPVSLWRESFGIEQCSKPTFSLLSKTHTNTSRRHTQVRAAFICSGLSLYFQCLPQTSWRCWRRPGCSCSSPPVRTCCDHTRRYRCQTPQSPPDVTGSHQLPFGSPPYTKRKIRENQIKY